MLRAITICPDEELAVRLAELLAGQYPVRVVRTVSRYPTTDELTQVVRACAPEVIFLSGEQLVRLRDLATYASKLWRNIKLIALARKADDLSAATLASAGVKESIWFPYDPQQVSEVMQRTKESLDRSPSEIPATELLFSFLPSKPGVGSSTLVTNLAVAAGRLQSDRSLLMDCDRSNGIIRFLLQIERSLAVPDLARQAFHLDEVIWKQVVTPIDNIDVIHSGAADSEQRVEPVHMQRILEFAARNYHSIFLDLSGSFEGFSIAAMEASRQIFVVVTPELASAHMAREKIRYLKRLNFIDKAAIVLNRAQKKSLVSREQIEDVLKLPVVASFSNDYHRVNAALTAGKPIATNCELGTQLQAFTAGLLDPKAMEGKSRSTGYFSLTAAKSLFRVVETMRAEGELR